MEKADGFSEEEFRKACAELEGPAPAGGGWESLVESEGFNLYRQPDEQTGLYEYKAFGDFKDCPPTLCADVYMDLEYRKQWDSYVKELYETNINGKMVVYWEVKYPFPMYNRDYVYIRDRRDLDLNGRTVHVMLAKSISVPEIPEKDGIIRVSDYRQSLMIESDGKNGCKVSMFYHDNPGGMIPSWLINWAAKNGVPNFLSDILKACKNYHKKI
ncbi:phosphatidylcholine transfer protein isoform X2 [Phascolarctos cinereus]|uniref:Phosphatidylcholine transfer protein n=1 Tax=Phascolarctos cinereus TaxID=38626 RepID=A0A6P5KV25_PHACI|nr:phosphatidylcholine transfer protein isoform X2 [Phascolarctos cinereus]